ncbi:DUF3265 domain-containing protein [Vibrio parahaemolyticus]|nr:DUF3265 domain-containing protein [Vibrio parahaemolyticus]
MHAAWHFWFAVSFVLKVVCEVGFGGIHPLTQR